MKEIPYELMDILLIDEYGVPSFDRKEKPLID